MVVGALGPQVGLVLTAALSKFLSSQELTCPLLCCQEGGETCVISSFESLGDTWV